MVSILRSFFSSRKSPKSGTDTQEGTAAETVAQEAGVTETVTKNVTKPIPALRHKTAFEFYRDDVFDEVQQELGNDTPRWAVSHRVAEYWANLPSVVRRKYIHLGEVDRTRVFYSKYDNETQAVADKTETQEAGIADDDDDDHGLDEAVVADKNDDEDGLDIRALISGNKKCAVVGKDKNQFMDSDFDDEDDDDDNDEIQQHQHQPVKKTKGKTKKNKKITAIAAYETEIQEAGIADDDDDDHGLDEAGVDGNKKCAVVGKDKNQFMDSDFDDEDDDDDDDEVQQHQHQPVKKTKGKTKKKKKITAIAAYETEIQEAGIADDDNDDHGLDEAGVADKDDEDDDDNDYEIQQHQHQPVKKTKRKTKKNKKFTAIAAYETESQEASIADDDDDDHGLDEAGVADKDNDEDGLDIRALISGNKKHGGVVGKDKNQFMDSDFDNEDDDDDDNDDDNDDEIQQHQHQPVKKTKGKTKKNRKFTAIAAFSDSDHDDNSKNKKENHIHKNDNDDDDNEEDDAETETLTVSEKRQYKKNELIKQFNKASNELSNKVDKSDEKKRKDRERQKNWRENTKNKRQKPELPPVDNENTALLEFATTGIFKSIHYYNFNQLTNKEALYKVRQRDALYHAARGHRKGFLLSPLLGDGLIGSFSIPVVPYHDLFYLLLLFKLPNFHVMKEVKDSGMKTTNGGALSYYMYDWQDDQVCSPDRYLSNKYLAQGDTIFLHSFGMKLKQSLVDAVNRESSVNLQLKDLYYHPGIVKTNKPFHQKLHQDSRNLDSYILHLPLSREGLHLRIGWFDDELKIAKQNFIFVPFGTAILLKSSVWHAGTYGSRGNIRFHSVISKGIWEGGSLIYMKDNIPQGFEFDVENHEKTELLEASDVSTTYRTKVDNQKTLNTVKGLRDAYPSKKWLPLLEP